MTFTKQEKSQLIAAGVCQILIKRLHKHTVAILVEKAGETLELGSGTCVKVGESFFIATATHVVKNYSRIRILCGQGPTDPKAREIYSPTQVGAHTNPNIDVAWLLLDTQTAEAIEKEFISTNRFKYDVSHVENEAAYMMGFPSNRLTLDHALQEMNFNPLGYLTDTIPEPEVLPSGAVSYPHQIYLDYPAQGNICSATRVSFALPPPHGMSGGGFWLLNINSKVQDFKAKIDTGLWTGGDPELIGIDESWYNTQRWVKGTQIKYWVESVLQSFPELESSFPGYSC